MVLCGRFALERIFTVRLWRTASQRHLCSSCSTSTTRTLIPCGTSDISVRKSLRLWFINVNQLSESLGDQQFFILTFTFLGATGAGNRYSAQFVKAAKLLHWNGHYKPWGRTSSFSDIWDKWYIPDPTGKFHTIRRHAEEKQTVVWTTCIQKKEKRCFVEGPCQTFGFVQGIFGCKIWAFLMFFLGLSRNLVTGTNIEQRNSKEATFNISQCTTSASIV